MVVLSGGRLRSTQKRVYGVDLTANECMILEYLRQHEWGFQCIGKNRTYGYNGHKEPVEWPC